MQVFRFFGFTLLLLLEFSSKDILQINLSFHDLLFHHQNRSCYQRRSHLDLYDQNLKISLLLSGLSLLLGPNSLQNASFYKKSHSNNEKPPNKAQKSTTLTNQTKKIQGDSTCMNASFKCSTTFLTSG